MKILHVSCSTRGALSESSRLSRKIVELLLRHERTAIVIERPIGEVPVPHVDAHYADAQHAPDAESTPGGSMSCSEVLIQELESADAVVIGTPMHNLMVPSTLKAWLDHIVRAGRTFGMTPKGKTGFLRDRPVFIAIASGGVFSGESARQPDLIVPYLKLVLGTTGLQQLHFFSVEGTTFGAEWVARARGETDARLQDWFETFSIGR
jgi:FMN-dependent NADH-azoreductase